MSNYPDDWPAQPETMKQLPRSIRVHYHKRLPTEIAARCLLNEVKRMTTKATCTRCHPTGMVVIQQLVRKGVMREVAVKCSHAPDMKARAAGERGE